MKTQFFLTTVIIIFLSSCSVALESKKYTSSEHNEGIVYSLPKNILKVNIVYTIRTPYELVNGVERKIGPATVSIEKPINVSSKLIADTDNSFILHGDRISNNFFIKSTLDFNLTQDGILSSIDADIEDQSVDFAEKIVIASGKIAKAVVAPAPGLKANLEAEISKLKNKGTLALADQNRLALLKEELTTLNFDSILFLKLIDLNTKFINTSDKDKLAVISSKIIHVKEQIKWFQLNNKTYNKTKEISYTAIIDPFKDYGTGSEIKTTITPGTNANYTHKILAKGIFPSDIDLTDIPSVDISLNHNQIEQTALPEYMEGIVVRHPSSTTIDLSVDNTLVGSEIVYMAQLGNTSIIPVKSKKGGKVKTSLKFNEVTGAITQHRIEASSGSEKVGNSLEKSAGSIQETIDYLNFEKKTKQLEALKSETSLSNEIYDLNNTGLAREYAELQMNQQILELQRSIDEFKEVEPEASEYEQTVEKLEQEQQLLNLQLMIKQLQDEIDQIGND